MTALAMPETVPLTDAASPTMQTNSGAGLGIGTTWGSSRRAASAVAVVKAGPGIARQLSCMPFSSLAGKNKARACLIVAIVLAFPPPVLSGRYGDVAGFRNFQIKC